jgi:hypothetical protein
MDLFFKKMWQLLYATLNVAKQMTLGFFFSSTYSIRIMLSSFSNITCIFLLVTLPFLSFTTFVKFLCFFKVPVEHITDS